MSLELWTLAIAVVTATTCALCGTLLVVKREALVAEGLSHAVLPGILVAFVFLQDRSSPLLIAAAGAAGLLMVLLVQAIERTRLVRGDASLGVVFPTLFSIGIILASRELRNTPFHAHCIIDGNLALAPLDELVIDGVPIAPKSFVVMTVVLVAVLAFLGLFFKELKLTIFDRPLAASFGFRPGLLHLGWLGLVSLTSVAAFDAAGSILVVALMIAPPAAAFLLTDDLRRMLAISAVLGIASAVAGFAIGLVLDVAPTGPMAAAAGAWFLVALGFAPERGLIARSRRHRRRRDELLQRLLVLRLVDPARPTHQLDEVAAAFPWSTRQFRSVWQRAERAGLVVSAGPTLGLTGPGREFASQCAGTAWLTPRAGTA